MNERLHDGGIRAASAPFGGVLIETARGKLAVNGGGAPDELDGFYLADARPPVAIVLTTEHIHRSRGVGEFAARHGIPLVGSLLAFARLRLQSPERWEILPPQQLAIGGIVLDTYPIRYDSEDPFALTISVNGETLGVVTDGRLEARDAPLLAKLRSCNKLWFANKLDRPPEIPKALLRRYRGNCNTSGELAELFRDYRGELVADPNCE